MQKYIIFFRIPSVSDEKTFLQRKDTLIFSNLSNCIELSTLFCHCPLALSADLRATWWRLGAAAASTTLRAGDKRSITHKNFCGVTAAVAPNRSLSAGILLLLVCVRVRCSLTCSGFRKSVSIICIFVFFLVFFFVSNNCYSFCIIHIMHPV